MAWYLNDITHILCIYEEDASSYENVFDIDIQSSTQFDIDIQSSISFCVEWQTNWMRIKCYWSINMPRPLTPVVSSPLIFTRWKSCMISSATFNSGALLSVEWSVTFDWLGSGFTGGGGEPTLAELRLWAALRILSKRHKATMHIHEKRRHLNVKSLCNLTTRNDM